ncbi:MAG: TetR/AcrR family transcriptional regulator [Desulfobacterales bacterium]|nr:TetR/AcrR family transcriptional regulator [Desulfobacterales bacterium]
MKPNAKEKIIKHAIDCIAQNANAGLDEIARAAGVGRATLYRHFKSREALLTELKLSAGNQLQAAVGPVFNASLSAREKLERIVRLLVPMGASLNVTAYFCNPIKKEQDPGVMASYETHMGQIRQLCLDLKQEKTLATDTPLVWLVASLTSLVFTAWEKVESGDIAPKQAPWLVLGTFLNGHGTPESMAWFNELKEANQ